VPSDENSFDSVSSNGLWREPTTTTPPVGVERASEVAMRARSTPDREALGPARARPPPARLEQWTRAPRVGRCDAYVSTPRLGAKGAAARAELYPPHGVTVLVGTRGCRRPNWRVTARLPPVVSRLSGLTVSRRYGASSAHRAGRRVAPPARDRPRTPEMSIGDVGRATDSPFRTGPATPPSVRDRHAATRSRLRRPRELGQPGLPRGDRLEVRLRRAGLRGGR